MPGPNAGRDLHVERRFFMDHISQFSEGLLIHDAEAVLDARRRVLERCAELMTEEPYRLMLDVLSARAVARTGDHSRAVAIVRQTKRRMGLNESAFVLANLEAVAGNRDEAMRLVTEIVRDRTLATRTQFDGPHLMLRISIESRDRERLERAVSQLSRTTEAARASRLRATLGARARLWWDEVQPQDLDFVSRSYAPAGAAVASLARWRMGQSREGDAAAMGSFAEEFPDAATEGRLARAAALIASGQASTSVAELSLLGEALLIPARVDFATLQLLHLARALRVVALEAVGEVDEARKEGVALVTELTPDLLPAILVNEVLQRTSP